MPTKRALERDPLEAGLKMKNIGQKIVLECLVDLRLEIRKFLDLSTAC